MNWLRTTHGYVRILVAAMVVAQSAGVISSPFAKADTAPTVLGSHVHHQHLQNEDGTANHHRGDYKASFTDHCCALHAIFTGIVCQAVVIEASATKVTRVAPATDLTQPTCAAEFSTVRQDVPRDISPSVCTRGALLSYTRLVRHASVSIGSACKHSPTTPERL